MVSYSGFTREQAEEFHVLRALSDLLVKQYYQKHPGEEYEIGEGNTPEGEDELIRHNPEGASYNLKRWSLEASFRRAFDDLVIRPDRFARPPCDPLPSPEVIEGPQFNEKQLRFVVDLLLKLKESLLGFCYTDNGRSIIRMPVEEAEKMNREHIEWMKSDERVQHLLELEKVLDPIRMKSE